MSKAPLTRDDPAIRAALELCLRLEAEACALRMQIDELLRPGRPDGPPEEYAPLAKILGIVCAEWQVPAAEVLGRSRTERVVFPRHAAMVLCRQFMRTSLRVTGEFFARKSWTVLKAEEAISARYDSCPISRARLDRVREQAAREFAVQPNTHK